MGRVSVKREPRWVDRFRQYKVFIDGVEVGALSNGGKFVTDCTNDEHSIQLKIDFWSSEVKTFKDCANFECHSNVSIWKIPFVLYFLLVPKKWIFLDFTSP